jgi:hypothetical protein
MHCTASKALGEWAGTDLVTWYGRVGRYSNVDRASFCSCLSVENQSTNVKQRRRGCLGLVRFNVLPLNDSIASSDAVVNGDEPVLQWERLECDGQIWACYSEICS